MCHKCQANLHSQSLDTTSSCKIHRGLHRGLRRNCSVSYPKVMDRIISQSLENYAMIHVLFGDVFQYLGVKIKGTRRIGTHSKHSKHILKSEIYDPIGPKEINSYLQFLGWNQPVPVVVFVQLLALNLDAPHPTRGHVLGPRSWKKHRQPGIPMGFRMVTYMSCDNVAISSLLMVNCGE